MNQIADDIMRRCHNMWDVEAVQVWVVLAGGSVDYADFR
jgi:hypothetical protein